MFSVIFPSFFLLLRLIGWSNVHAERGDVNEIIFSPSSSSKVITKSLTFGMSHYVVTHHRHKSTLTHRILLLAY